MHLVPLHAGPLSLVFQPEQAAIRHLFAGSHEILRGIGAPLRDHVWTTVPPVVDGLVLEQGTESFRVIFNARCRAGAVDFQWRGEISGTEDGTLVFTFDGEALGDFQRSRIGFCVLHPAEIAGVSCIVEHTDGRSETARFPAGLAPHQPFFDVRALTHELAPGVRAEVRMEGDTFETEDQRNWTDASFKTYCTPLAQPRPVMVARGTRIQQRVTVRLHGAVPAAPASFPFPWRSPASVELTIGQPSGHALPQLGFIWDGAAAAASERTLAALHTLRPSHVRVDLRLADPEFRAALRAAANTSGLLDASLELAVFVDDAAAQQIAALVAVCAALETPPRIARWMIFHEEQSCTSPALVALLRRALEGTAFAAPIGGGSTSNFTELNREPSVASVADFTVHACNPQVHAFDPASMVETLAIQGATVASARRLSGGRPAIVSPVTLTPRWQPGAPGAPAGLPAGLMPFRDDPRHTTPFAAAWMLGSIAALAAQATHSVTYFEAVGVRGLVDETGELRPVGEAFRTVAQFAGSAVTTATSSHPLRIAALALESPGRRILLVANLERTSQRVEIRGAWGARSFEASPHGVHVLELQARRCPSPG